MEDEKRSKVTVSPVPETFGSEQAGFRLYISFDRSALIVDNLVTVSSNATSDLDLEQEVFKRSKRLPKTPITKVKNDGLKENRLPTNVVSTSTACVQECRLQKLLQSQGILEEPFNSSISTNATD